MLTFISKSSKIDKKYSYFSTYRTLDRLRYTRGLIVNTGERKIFY